jgi:hypothetical protein
MNRRFFAWFTTVYAVQYIAGQKHSIFACLYLLLAAISIVKALVHTPLQIVAYAVVLFVPITAYEAANLDAVKQIYMVLSVAANLLWGPGVYWAMCLRFAYLVAWQQWQARVQSERTQRADATAKQLLR